mmetsp:Transcript_53734/g.155018  ORF Transcript_53734/g.155018 Transcript_53734/m.155018 type:complete len:223 (-) Transcript_53734:1-669(-)
MRQGMHRPSRWPSEPRLAQHLAAAAGTGGGGAIGPCNSAETTSRRPRPEGLPPVSTGGPSLTSSAAEPPRKAVCPGAERAGGGPMSEGDSAKWTKVFFSCNATGVAGNISTSGGAGATIRTDFLRGGRPCASPAAAAEPPLCRDPMPNNLRSTPGRSLLAAGTAGASSRHPGAVFVGGGGAVGELGSSTTSRKVFLTTSCEPAMAAISPAAATEVQSAAAGA